MPREDSTARNGGDAPGPSIARWRAFFRRRWRSIGAALVVMLLLTVGGVALVRGDQRRDDHTALLALVADIQAEREALRRFERVARPELRPVDVIASDALWLNGELSRGLDDLAAADPGGEWPVRMRQAFDTYAAAVDHYLMLLAVGDEGAPQWIEREVAPRRAAFEQVTADAAAFYEATRQTGRLQDQPLFIALIAISGLLLLTALIAKWRDRRVERTVARRIERRFQVLIQQSSDVVVVLDRDGRFTYVSPAITGLVDYAPSQLIGMDATALVHPDELAAVNEAFAVAIASPGVKTAATFRFKAADGEWRWVEAVPTNLLDDPLIGGLVLNCRDVTDKVRSDEELRRREARFRSLVQHSHDVISIYDEDWLLRYASPAMERLLGLDAAEMEGTDVGHLVHPDDQFRVRLNFERLMRTPDRAQTFSFRAKHVLGGWRHVETIARNRLADPSIQGIVANARDVTERVEAAIEQRKVESRYRALVDQASDVTVIVDPHGTVTWVSPAVEWALGLSPNRVVGTAFSSLLAAGDGDRLDQLLQEDVAEAGATASVTVEFPHRRDEVRVFDVVATNYIEDRAIGGIVLNCRDVTEREELLSLLWNQANHDALTDLPTRDYFLNQLEEQLERNGRTFAVCLLDVDGFKLVNDSLGHAVGDRVLVNAVERLRRVAREGELLARFGGDEFTLLVEDVPNEVSAKAVAERMVAAVSTPFALDDGRQVSLGMSAGIALSRPGDGAAALLRHADMAMYTAKSLGKGRVAVFDSAMASRDRDRLELASDLRYALEHDGLHLAYQPVVELQTGRIVACEALARWDHPRRGDIAPAEFIQIAEEFSCVEQLDGWVLKTACSEAARWQADLVSSEPVGIHVNVSPVQFARPAFAGLVAAVLKETGISAELLTLDVTESMAMDEPERAQATLADLHALGIRLTVDRFGTGMSNLAALERSPFDELKIDRSLIHAIDVGDGAVVVDAILNVAHSLGLAVTAEGIETPQQLNALLSLRCEFGQGRLFDPPLRRPDILERLAEQAAARERFAAPAQGNGTDLLTEISHTSVESGHGMSRGL